MKSGTSCWYRPRGVLFTMAATALALTGCGGSVDSGDPVAESAQTQSSHVASSGYTGSSSGTSGNSSGQTNLSSGADASVILVLGSWTEGELLGSSDTMTFSAAVTPGQSYSLAWDDEYEGSGSYSADVYVQLADGSDLVVPYEDSGYLTPFTFTAAGSSVVIRVRGFLGSTGTFALSLTEEGSSVSSGVTGSSGTATSSSGATGGITFTLLNEGVATAGGNSGTGSSVRWLALPMDILFGGTYSLTVTEGTGSGVAADVYTTLYEGRSAIPASAISTDYYTDYSALLVMDAAAPTDPLPIFSIGNATDTLFVRVASFPSTTRGTFTVKVEATGSPQMAAGAWKYLNIQTDTVLVQIASNASDSVRVQWQDQGDYVTVNTNGDIRVAATGSMGIGSYFGPIDTGLGGVKAGTFRSVDGSDWIKLFTQTRGIVGIRWDTIP